MQNPFALKPDFALVLNHAVADPRLFAALIDAARRLFTALFRPLVLALFRDHEPGVIILKLRHNAAETSRACAPREHIVAVPRVGTADAVLRDADLHATFNHFGCKNSCIGYRCRGSGSPGSRGWHMKRRRLFGAFVLLLAGAVAHAADTPQAAAPTAASAVAPPPAELFARLPFLQGPMLSPDGTRIAAKITIKGELRLAIVPLGDAAHIRLINPGASDINDWDWVNNDWLVVRIGQSSAVEGDSWYLRRALGVSATGGKMQLLGKDRAAQSADDVLWIAHDGSPHIRLALQTSIYSNDVGLWPEVRDFDVSTGKSTPVVPSTDRVMNWYSDGNGAVRLGIAYNDDARSYRVLYRDKDGQPFRTVIKAKGRSASLGALPAMFLGEPGKAIAIDDADGYDALYSYNLGTLKTGDKLFGVPGYDLGGVIPSADGSRMIGVRYTDTRPRTHWFEPALALVQSQLDASVGARNAHIISWSSDFAILVVAVESTDRPTDYYTYRPDEGVMHILARADEHFGKESWGTVSTIRYKARDGLEISAVLTLPKNRPGKNLPLILMPHGGPFARDDERYDWWVQFLASRGYAVLQPNYRGSSGYGQAFTDKGKGQWGLAMQDDLTDAVKWATGQGIADARRVCIAGGSYGGYAALRAAQRDTGVYRCAVSFAGVADMPGMLRYDGSFLNGERNKDYLREQAPDLKGVSPLNFAADFSIPVLLMHGKADMVVPVKQSRQMADRLKAAGKDYRYVEQPLGDHHFSREADRLQFLQELEAFLAKYDPA
jgi:dipeptidyl aminopeptidase/acylaminoacyl peptidase